MARALVHLLKYKLGLDEASTQTTQAERATIAKYAAGKKRVVEIGVYEGVTTSVIASALDASATLYGIDPFFAGRVGICWSKAIATAQARRGNPDCRIEFVEELSHIASEKLDGSFDFVFIDGDHSLEGITQDWEDWSARVETAGIIALHDTVVPEHNPRVAQLGSHKYFVDHIQHDPRFEIVEQVDSLSVMRRSRNDG